MFESVLLRCGDCRSEYKAIDKVWRCECGGFLELFYEKGFDLDKLNGRDWNFWRYEECLAISAQEKKVSLGEPCTPLLLQRIGGQELYLKLENINPTGSFKDRGSAMMINAAQLRGIDTVVEDSSGNAGASVAAYCANAGISAKIFVPEGTTKGKLDLISLSGAELNKIPGDRQQSAIAALEAAQDNYYASHCWDPFFIEGVKTIAFEIAEQLEWKAPDTVYLPVGNGSLLLGVFQGFLEMLELGIIDHMPVLNAVQTAGCAPIYSHWSGQDLEHKPTVAEGIAVQTPPRLEQIIKAVESTYGQFFLVHEEEIKRALEQIIKLGIVIEPTSAAAVSVALNADCDKGKVVVPITGSGLKAVGKLSDLI
jgi:threonine synthase